jgi:prostaglandin-H2 D-isomerase / glutathione transferase
MKLFYFDSAGRAEGIRLLLKHAKAEFEDVRFKGEEWPAFKESGKLEYKQMPALEMDGKMYVQTHAIMALLGSKYGYYPTDPESQYKIWNCIGGIDDFVKKWLDMSFSSQTEEKKAELKKAFFEKDFPFFAKIWADKLANNTNPLCMIGDSLTIADFQFFAMWKGFGTMPDMKAAYEQQFELYPNFKAYLTQLDE